MEADSKQLKELVSALNELRDDTTVPKNVKVSVENTLKIIEDPNSDNSLKMDKAIEEMEKINEDNNLQPFTRTQIWNIISMLEKVQTEK